MARSNSPARRLAPLVGSVLLATIVLLLILVSNTRATVVELEIEADQAVFTVLPILPESTRNSVAWSSAPSPLKSIPLLAPDLEVLALEVHEFDLLKTSLAGRLLDLRPRLDGAVTVRTASPDEPLQPDLTVHGPTFLTLETSGRSRSGSERVVLRLEPRERKFTPAEAGSPGAAEAGARERPAAPLGGWDLLLPTQTSMILLPERLEAAGATSRTANVEETEHVLSSTAPPLSFGGGARPSWLGLTFKPRAGAATILRELDPATGEVSERRLPAILPEVTAIVWRDRLVSLERVAADEEPKLLLKPGLRIQGIELSRRLKSEEESFIRGGQIRFPAGEKQPVDLTPDIFLTVEAKDPLILRSLSRTGGRFKLHLWGEPTSLRLGPTPAVRTELLPSLFEWIYTHRLRTLLYSTLAWIVGVSLAAAKFFGLPKQKTGGAS